MKSLLIAAAWGVLLASAAARADDTHDSLAEEYVKAYTNFATGLAAIKDKDSATKTMPDLEKTGQKILDLKKRFDKLGEPSEDQKAEMTKKFAPKMQELQKTITAEMLRISKLDGGPDMLKGVENVLAPVKK